MKKHISFIFIITSILIISCQQQNNSRQESNQESITTLDTLPDEDELQDNETKEFGTLTNIEDGIYPMFVLTFEFPERQINSEFNLNLEAISLDVEALYNLKGKYTTLHYTSGFESNLNDLHLNGTSIFNDNVQEKDANWKKITGILYGARFETTSDLPDNISVIDKQGKIILFKCFISPQMIQANEQKVTAYYSDQEVHTITYLMPSKD